MDRGDVIVWSFDSVRASLRSLDVPWDTLKFSAAASDAAVDQMIAIGTRHADGLAPQQWNRRFDNLMTQMGRGATRPWILREVYWLAESLGRIASRPFFERTSEEKETCNRLRNVQRLSRHLREQEEYAAERDLLTSMQRAFEKIETPSSEVLRLASQVYHLIGDLHNFHLAEKQTCLQAYKTEERILRELSKQPNSEPSLASFRFWLNRNSALAYHRYGDLPEARRRLHAAIAIAEEFPGSIADAQLIEKERVRLKQWKSPTGDGVP
jgi:hypothetical protein